MEVFSKVRALKRWKSRCEFT